MNPFSLLPDKTFTTFKTDIPDKLIPAYAVYWKCYTIAKIAYYLFLGYALWLFKDLIPL